MQSDLNNTYPKNAKFAFFGSPMKITEFQFLKAQVIFKILNYFFNVLTKEVLSI